MSFTKQNLGRWGEQRAANFLQAKGYELIDTNVRTEYGEIDIIARSGRELVFVEVKTRSSDTFGHPEEAITEAKQQHMIDSAEAYLQSSAQDDALWRIDVIAIQRNSGDDTPEILHIENALG
ncbi:MAG: YraN family protein [Chloroflexi bacterium]|nr:MAG: YraN family protein [Chloroflexota bacterium]MBL1195870.1 YraN family protein [Chloroflexota bacterium]NOH13162.1 YraN family protein [Chloroflexota bacterium]